MATIDQGNGKKSITAEERISQKHSWIHKFISNVLKVGPMPKHVAFIMDGNRRFANKLKVEKIKGHEMGFEKLTDCLEWCLYLGITEVTVYAFSIENFKRSKEEVTGLMELAKQKFQQLMQSKQLISKYGVCVRVLGDLSLLSPDVQEIVARAVNFSKNNTNAFLNVCFSYTSQDEICAAVRVLAEGVQMDLIEPSDITADLVEKCLYTNKSPNPDLLLRTSGEVRLSDFLLWQTSYSCLAFVDALWPEFSVWHFYAAILQYQRCSKYLQDAKEISEQQMTAKTAQEDVATVLKELRTELQDPDICPESHSKEVGSRLQDLTATRKIRVENFLRNVQRKRDEFFIRLGKLHGHDNCERNEDIQIQKNVLTV